MTQETKHSRLCTTLLSARMKKLFSAILIFAFSMLTAHAQSTSSSAKADLAKLKAAMETLDKNLTKLESNLHLSWKGFVKPDFNGHEYVDLGLPSGVLWATCNLGAEKPEEVGGYYTVIMDNSNKYILEGDNKNFPYGNATGVFEILPEDDAAHVNWGGTWRMPTAEEGEELFLLCTWEPVTVNGLNGFLGTSKINGNTILLPQGGRNSYRNNPTYGGNFSTSTLIDNGAYFSFNHFLYFKNWEPIYYNDTSNISTGANIRPVTSCSY